jgi:hypothetical protein
VEVVGILETMLLNVWFCSVTKAVFYLSLSYVVKWFFLTIFCSIFVVFIKWARCRGDSVGLSVYIRLILIIQDWHFVPLSIMLGHCLHQRTWGVEDFVVSRNDASVGLYVIRARFYLLWKELM